MVLNYPVLYKSMDTRAEAAISSAVQQAVADAESLWAPEKFDGVFPVKGFGIKRLQPHDIMPIWTAVQHAPNTVSDIWAFSITTANAWTNIISQSVMSDSAYIIITGFLNYDGAPDVDAIKITADGIEYPTIDIQEMYGWDVATAYFSHPIIVRPEKMITIAVRARSTTAGAATCKQFGLLGYVVAKRSYLIGQV